MKRTRRDIAPSKPTPLRKPCLRLLHFIVPLLFCVTVVWRVSPYGISSTIRQKTQTLKERILHSEITQNKYPSQPLLNNDRPKAAHFADNAQHVLTRPDTYHRRLVSVGDLHGDLGNALAVFEAAGVILPCKTTPLIPTLDGCNATWSGEVDALVQTGDIIDRGDDTIPIYTVMHSLGQQAGERAGGEVVSLLGNHEWMNVIGDWRYVYPSEIKTFGDADKRMAALRGEDPEILIGTWWREEYHTAARVVMHPSAGKTNDDFIPGLTKVGDAAYSFVHGGLSATTRLLSPYPSKINIASHSLLHKLQTRTPVPRPYPPNPYPGLPNSATQEEAALLESDGPVWYRGWAEDVEDEVFCKRMEHVLERTGTRRMVMGHTPQFQGITARCQGRIILHDCGISHAYGGPKCAAVFDYWLADGKEREVITAVYADPGRESEVLWDEVRMAG